MSIPFRRFFQIQVVVLLCAGALANNPPSAPVITEPFEDGRVLNPEDVHMEAGPFIDPDPNDAHLCSDYEIWSITPSQRVWVTSCIGGVERVHTHLGDGVFENSHAGRTGLFPETDFVLRVRFRDDSGDSATEWSDWSLRYFTTGPLSTVFPLEAEDVLDNPPPTWLDATGQAVALPAGPPPAELILESEHGDALLRYTGVVGGPAALTNLPPDDHHHPLRLRFTAGADGLILGETDLTFAISGESQATTVYAPGVNLPPGGQAVYWISRDGATYVGDVADEQPDFSTLARGAAVPWQVMQPGYRVEIVASGFQLPVNIAFVPNPGSQPGDPLYYVTELYGDIKVVTRDGTVSDYATGLVNFNPTGLFPGSGEQGLAGLAVDPDTGDLFASVLYDPPPAGGPHYPKVIRLSSTDGGLTASSIVTILDMPGETQGQSHQVSNVTFGPDGKLYVHNGDGFAASTGQNLNSYRGKILRLNKDGTPAADNPFYNAGDGIDARDYVIAYGLRNPFGGAWRATDGRHYTVENGPSVDRLSVLVPGRNYLWDGSDASMQQYALHNWSPASGPVNMAFIEPQTFGGSGFPSDRQDRGYVTESGGTYATGPAASQGKMITDFKFDAAGNLSSPRSVFARYTGSGKGTAVAIAAGPDGLYFSDFYKDQDYQSPIDRGSNILRIRYIGQVKFSADASSAPQAPAAFRFADLSDVPGATQWFWDFGDGQTSTEQNPVHVYQSPGTYDVRLSVVGVNGVRMTQRTSFVQIGIAGFQGDYFNGESFESPALSRLDPLIAFDWGGGSPDPALGNDFYSVRWSGQIVPDFSETYTFHSVTDDGVRLWINDQPVIDHWFPQPPTERTGQITLVAGQTYALRMEFYERAGGAVAYLDWSSPSQPRQAVPPSATSTSDIAATFSPPPPAAAGQPVELVLTVSNPSGEAAHGARVAFSLPPDAALLSVAGDGLTLPGGQRYLGAIPAGQSREFRPTIGFGPDAIGPATVSATCLLNEVDTAPTDNIAAAELTVQRGPRFVSQPAATIACSGDDVTFAAGASGLPAPTFQWRVDGVEIDGATSSTLLLADVDPNLAGAYDVVISNALGSLDSTDATLAVETDPPLVLTHPRGRLAAAGSNLTLTVAGASQTAMSIQWRKNGIAIPGATGPTLPFTPLAAADQGVYDAVLSNACGSTISNPARIRVAAPLERLIRLP